MLRKVAIVGASGRLGKHIFKALHSSQGFDITVITRPSSSNSVYPPPTKVVQVPDEYPQDEVVEAFKGHDAVILTLGFAGEKHLPGLARASIQAGVKRLIASGFGVDAGNKEVAKVFPVAASKAAMLEDLRSLEQPGWTWTDVACGLFLDFCISVNFLGIRPKQRTAEIWDDGNARFTATTRDAIGEAVAGILNHPEQTRNRVVHIASSELSLNELLAAEQKIVGKEDWEVTHVNTEEEIIKAQEAVVTATDFMPKMMATGRIGLAVNFLQRYEANFTLEGQLDNELLGVRQESIDDVVARVRAE